MANENSEVTEVIVEGPSVSTIFGSTHPLGFLFENGVNLEHAKKDHEHLVQTLREKGIKVTSLEDLLRNLPHEELLHLVMQRLHYRPAPPLTLDDFTSEEQEKYFSDEYKLKAISKMDTETLITLVLCPSEVLLRKSDKNTHIEASLLIHPQCNLIFTRDQEIVTANGIVIGNMSPVQRSEEPSLTRFLFERSGKRILGVLEDPCKLEGGDFFPMGTELCFVGCGLRTNDEAIQFMLEHDWFGTTRVAVVRDLYDQSQDRMHLDCIFNIVTDDYVVLLESVITNPARKREVNEYILGSDGKYTLHLSMEFSQYLERNGFHIIRVSEHIQQNYGINFLNLGGGKILLLNKDMEALLKETLKDKVQTTFVEFRDVNDMYGGIHCATQAFRKDRNFPMQKNTHEDSHSMQKHLTGGVAMEISPAQTTNRVLMIAPTAFEFNLETSSDNPHMHNSVDVSEKRSQMLQQYSIFVDTLRQNGVQVSVFNHEFHHQTPDACFPNNWFSTHSDRGGKECILYPMKAFSRRRERRTDLIQYLKHLGYDVNEALVPLETEPEPVFLEGTGSLVLNRENRTAYCSISERSHERVATEWAKMMDYKVVTFHATYSNTKPVYHTNVALSVGTSVAIFCDEAVTNSDERQRVIESLGKSGKKVIRISRSQMEHYCGNALELSTQTSNKNIMVMSKTAFEAFTEEQKQVMEESCKIVYADISLLETWGGGSVRCCIAELF